MKTFQQFSEEVTGQSVGAGLRRGIDKATKATYNFGKGFFTKKSGSKPGSAQDRGAQVRKSGDSAAKYGTDLAIQRSDRRNKNITGFVKGLVTGKDK